VNDETIVKYDISANYEIHDKVLEVKLEEVYNPKKYSDYHVGISGIAESYISTKILEREIPSDVVIDGWNQYDRMIPFDRIIKFLIARDVFLLKVPRLKYVGSAPSWDVCISLAMYLRLCERIENFEAKLHTATEVGDQIRGNLKMLDSDIQKGDYFSKHLLPLLHSMHSLNDELELAYNIHRLGYNVRFGGRGEPDYFIDNVAIEQKSRFPELEHMFRKNLPSNFQYAEALKDLVLEIKQHKKGLSRSDIFFCNMSRLVEGFKFYASTQLTKVGPNAGSFNFADMFNDFDIMMKCVYIFLKSGKVAVPYVKLYSLDPKITCPFPIPEEAFDIIVKEKSKPYLSRDQN
jgi:hypothetical protein